METFVHMYGIIRHTTNSQIDNNRLDSRMTAHYRLLGPSRVGPPAESVNYFPTCPFTWFLHVSRTQLSCSIPLVQDFSCDSRAAGSRRPSNLLSFSLRNNRKRNRQIRRRSSCSHASTTILSDLFPRTDVTRSIFLDHIVTLHWTLASDPVGGGIYGQPLCCALETMIVSNILYPWLGYSLVSSVKISEMQLFSRCVLI